MDYFRVARHPSRIDVKRGDHFLQADFPVLISSMSGLAIYHSSRRSWQANWQRSLAQRAGNTSRTGSNGNPHPPAPDARASAVTARAPAQVAVAL